MELIKPVIHGTEFIPLSSSAVTPSPLGRLPFGKLGYPSSVTCGDTFPSGKAKQNPSVCFADATP